MSERIDTLPRSELAKALGGNPRVVAAFERQSLEVAANSEAVAGATEATDRLQQASFVVLSPNNELTGERVLRAEKGVRARDDGQYLRLAASDEVPHVEGGFPVYLYAVAGTALELPVTGTLATTDQSETLANKTLDAPTLTGLSDYPDDTAAGAGGTPVGGIYRTGSLLKVRVA